MEGVVGYAIDAGTKNKSQERGTGSPVGRQRWNTFCQRLVDCQAGLASVLSVHSWGKARAPWQLLGLGSAGVGLS